MPAMQRAAGTIDADSQVLVAPCAERKDLLTALRNNDLSPSA